MNTLIVAIVVFSIISSLVSKGKKGQPRKPWDIPWSPEWEKPWQPPATPPRRVSTNGRTPNTKQWPGTLDADPAKQEELTQATGKEGEWGDEGRPGTLARGMQQGIRSQGQLPVAVMGDTNKLVNSPVPVEDPAPDYTMSDNPLIQGVIWSEILNRPRALRPFRGPRG